MYKAGGYVVSTYFWDNMQWFRVEKKGSPKHHTHVPLDKGFNAARMIAIRANKGAIPEHYPRWMVVAINRLWFGADFETREDMNNDDLMINNLHVRIPPRKYKKKRQKHDLHVFMRYSG